MQEHWQAAAVDVQARTRALLSTHAGAPRWGDTIAAAAHICASADQLLAATVQCARADGASWQVIGDALGVTRQAAFQRFGKPLDPRTGEPMNTTPLADAPNLTRTILDDLTAGSWTAVTARFDATMSEALSDDGLGEVWAQIIGQVGALERRGTTQSSRAGELTITNTPLTFEAGDLTARITFRDDRSIAGLYFLEPQAA